MKGYAFSKAPSFFGVSIRQIVGGCNLGDLGRCVGKQNPNPISNRVVGSIPTYQIVEKNPKKSEVQGTGIPPEI